MTWGQKSLVPSQNSHISLHAMPLTGTQKYTSEKSVVMEAHERKHTEKFVCFMSALRNVMRPRGCQFKIGQQSSQTKVFAPKFCCPYSDGNIAGSLVLSKRHLKIRPTERRELVRYFPLKGPILKRWVCLVGYCVRDGGKLFDRNDCDLNATHRCVWCVGPLIRFVQRIESTQQNYHYADQSLCRPLKNFVASVMEYDETDARAEATETVIANILG